MNELIKNCRKLREGDSYLKKRILSRAKNYLKTCEKELKEFDFPNGFSGTCNEGVWAYFNYLAEKENMKLLIKYLSAKKKRLVAK